ncbi:MAG: hypothetical protein ACR2JY_11280 [Chloroflexota bacterium]
MTVPAVGDPVAENATPQKVIKVKHEGKIIGYFLPAPPGWNSNDQETRRIFERLGEAVEKAQRESGLDEEALARALSDDAG